MKRFVIVNKRALFFFFSSILVAFVVAGIILYVNHEKELKSVRTELKEQRAEKQKIEKENSKKMLEEKVQNKEQEELVQEQVRNDQNQSYSSEKSISSSISNNGSVNASVVPGTESDVIAYFSEQERYAQGSEQDISVRERLKNGVHTIYQFLFHGGTIHGKTFRELSSSAKLQVLKIALSIDSKIDSYFPNYKQSIKQGASNLKSKIVITYLETTNKICTNYEAVCTQAREDFKTMKNSFKISFSLIAGLAKEGSTAIKEWYLSTK